jgi:signal transduction histidine kinase/CheY-like chemotaxis protein
VSHLAERPLIWITDDSAVEARFTERALGNDYEFEYFPDGSIVLERLASGGKHPDLLLLDWVMPGVTGDEVCRFLRSQPQTADLPIIIVTASRIETEDVVEGLSIGANDYVARPFVPEELRARVDNAIRAKRLREVAARERNRLTVINRLGRAFVDVGPRFESVFEILAATLIDGLCDGISITIMPGLVAGTTIARHRDRSGEHLLASFAATDPCNYSFHSRKEARARMPAAYHPAIDRFGLSALTVVPFPARSPITGVVTAVRDEGGPGFEPEDIVTIETCLEYAALALEKALRFDAERAMRSELQMILEQMPISIVVLDGHGAVTHMNQMALTTMPWLRGMRHSDDIRSAISLRTLDGELVTPQNMPLARVLRGETVRGVELEVVLGDEPPRYVRSSAVPLQGASGIGAAVVAFDDITQQRLAAAEREQAIELQRYVLGIVSHDLRSPLQTLLMGCEGIKLFAGDNPKILQFVGRMESTAGRMRGIIEQLLDVVRSQLGGGIPVTHTDVELGDVVTSVIGEMSLAYPHARFEPRLGSARGRWDRDRLAQVVTNLVGNAIQHGEKQSPVWIETEMAGDHAILRVKNRTVAQLSDEQKSRIFVPFRRTKQPTGASSGLGLGLYIASEILHAHKGEISVESDSSMTTFIVRLPLQPEGPVAPRS